MNFHYPNGKVYHKTEWKSAKKSPLTFANRGMRFEEAINESNEYYLNKQIAVIHKKPTPIQIADFRPIRTSHTDQIKKSRGFSPPDVWT